MNHIALQSLTIKATRRKLLRKFGSVSGIRQASQTELALVVGDKLAQVIHSALVV